MLGLPQLFIQAVSRLECPNCHYFSHFDVFPRESFQQSQQLSLFVYLHPSVEHFLLILSHLSLEIENFNVQSISPRRFMLSQEVRGSIIVLVLSVYYNLHRMPSI